MKNSFRRLLAAGFVAFLPLLASAAPRATLWLENHSAAPVTFKVDGGNNCAAAKGEICEFLPDCNFERSPLAHCVVVMLGQGPHTIVVDAGKKPGLTFTTPLTYYPAEQTPDGDTDPEEYSKHCLLVDSSTGLAFNCKD